MSEKERPSIEELIEASSFGTPEAKAARESVSPEVGRAIALAARYYGETRAFRQDIERYAATLEDIAEKWGHADDAHTRQVARRLRVILRKHSAGNDDV